MLYTAEGAARAAVVSIAHLSDEERQFVVTLLLSKLVTWMRAQSGSPNLRAMVYTKMQGLSLSYLSTRETGDLLNRVSQDTRRIQQFIAFWGSDALTQVLTLVAIGTVMFFATARVT